tara:strand:- start:1076 stop:1219 length:144 start_codon:yes stop_codon:yes gene_type:complete
MEKETNWDDWKWQQRNKLKSADKVRDFFPNFPEKELELLREYEKTRR